MKKIAKLEKPLVNRIVGHGMEKVEDMLANPLNFRLHPDNQQQALAGAIDDIGFIRSVTVNQRTGRVVDGHLRVTLAARSNVDELPVEYVDLSEAEEAQALLSLDPIAALAASDKAKLDELMRSVQSDDERVQQMMADIAEREGLEYGREPQGEDPGAQVDKAEELRVKWGVELGQLWKLGEHRLICGDCTDRAVVERVMGGEKADLVYTDPPYGYEKEIEGDESIEAALKLYDGAFGNDISGDDAWAIVDTPKKYISEFIDVTEAHGWKTREPVLHMYRNSMANGVYGTNIFELSFVYSKGKPKVNHRHLNGVDVARKAGHDNIHPTQKFVESYEHYLEQFCPSGSVVVDFFLGSGTTLIACERLSRKCRAIEISPGYVAVAIQRWVDMTGGTPELIER